MMKTFYQYECKDCKQIYFTDWKTKESDMAFPYCPNCGNEYTSELTGEVINHG